MSDGETPSTPAKSDLPLQGPADTPSVALEPAPEEACAILLVQAKQAFQENRRKDCLVLTHVILAIEADNKEAQVIENWIRSDLQKDIDVVRSSILKSADNPDMESVQRAERKLRAILLVDPHNDQANRLLQDVRSAASKMPTEAPKPEMEPVVSVGAEQALATTDEEYPGYSSEPPQWRRLYTALALVLVVPLGALALWKYHARPAAQAAVGVASASNAGTGVLDIALNSGVQVYVDGEYRGTTPMEPLRLAPKVYHLKYVQDGKEIGREDVEITAGNATQNTIKVTSGKLVFIVVPATGVVLKIDGKLFGVTPESTDVAPGIHQLEFSAVGYAPASSSVVALAGKRTMVPVLLKSLTAADGGSPTTPATPPAGNSPANSASASMGTLTLNSTIDVDVYEKDRRLGSANLVLDRPAGPLTLEFRHDNLRKTATYNIQAGTNTTVTVAFEITVQINVYPYAEVFLFGDPIVPLGFTPLNKVSVPVGGILIFRHPKYPEKRYVVTTKDSGNSISWRFE